MRYFRFSSTTCGLALILAAIGVVSCSDEPTAPENVTPPYKIAFLSARDGNNEIYVMNSDGTGQQRLTNNGADDRTFAWSPDGTRIVFLSDRTDVYELYMMRPDGSFQTRLTTSTHLMGEIEAVPAWSPDGSQIAFCSARAGDKEVYVMNTDGSGEMNASQAPDREDYDPSWRPDGLMLTYVSKEPPSPETYWICSVSPEGSIREVYGVSSCRKGTPCWSPVGSSLAWQEYCGTHCLLSVCHIEINGMSIYTTTEGNMSSLAWSPDGSTLVFVRGGENARDIYRLDAETLSETRLTSSPSGTESLFPAWSPDGSEIVFASNRAGNYGIYVMNGNGTNVRRLTDSAGNDASPACAVSRN